MSSFFIGRATFNGPKWNPDMTIALQKLPEPDISNQDEETYSHEKSLVFQEIEGVYCDISEPQTQASVRFFSTLSVATCIVAYLYNDQGERFALHHSFDELDWKDIFSHFKQRDFIKVILVGGDPNDTEVERSNSHLKLAELLATLYKYVMSNQEKMKLQIVSQKLLNKNALMKKDIHGSVTNTVQQILNKISLYYFKEPSSVILNHHKPKENFKEIPVENYNQALVNDSLTAIEFFKVSHPQFTRDEFNQLAKMLCSSQGFNQIESSVYLSSRIKPHLTEFAFNLVNHRVVPIDAPQVIPMSIMRQAYFTSHLCNQTGSPKLLKIIHPKGVEPIYFDEKFIRAIHAHVKQLPELRAAYLKENINFAFINKFVVNFSQLSVSHAKRMEKDLIKIIEYYVEHPECFITKNKEPLGEQLTLEENLRKLCAQANLDQIKGCIESARVRIDINAQGAEEKRTPLHMVLVKASTIFKFNAPGFDNCLAVVKHLCGLKARVDIPNKDGKTVIQLAEELFADPKLSESSRAQAKQLLDAFLKG